MHPGSYRVRLVRGVARCGIADVNRGIEILNVGAIQSLRKMEKGVGGSDWMQKYMGERQIPSAEERQMATRHGSDCMFM